MAEITGRVLVIGLGASGTAAVRALSAAGVSVVAAESDPTSRGIEEVRALGVDVHVTRDPSDLLGEVAILVPSPGISEHAPVILDALERGLQVWSEPELGWRLHPRRTIAITGTNGKTSVTELITAMLAAAGTTAVACGNIGLAYTEAAANASSDTVLVAELSSFQLRFATSLAPEVGLLLNVAPDHLDWHGGFAAYGAAKARMWHHQPASAFAVANADDATVVALLREHAVAPARWFSGRRVPSGDALGPGVGVDTERGALISTLDGAPVTVVSLADLAVDAPHHRENLAAAASAAMLAGASVIAVAAAARAYRPGRHRLEVVADRDGVVFVDDSKATNPHAAAAALASAPSIVWIAGGITKGVDLGVLAPALGAVHAAFLIGEAAQELADLCAASAIPATTCATIEDAVRAAAAVARPGDTILLAPACASFDQFRNYAERGDRFAVAARQLTESTPESTPETEVARGRD